MAVSEGSLASMAGGYIRGLLGRKEEPHSSHSPYSECAQACEKVRETPYTHPQRSTRLRRVKGVPANPKRHQMRPVLIGPCCTLVSMKGLRFQLFSTLHTLYTRSGTRSRVAHRAPRTRSHHRSLCCTTTRVGPEGVCLGHSLYLFGVWVTPVPFRSLAPELYPRYTLPLSFLYVPDSG